MTEIDYMGTPFQARDNRQRLESVQFFDRGNRQTNKKVILFICCNLENPHWNNTSSQKQLVNDFVERSRVNFVGLVCLKSNQTQFVFFGNFDSLFLKNVQCFFAVYGTPTYNRDFQTSIFISLLSYLCNVSLT